MERNAAALHGACIEKAKAGQRLTERDPQECAHAMRNAAASLIAACSRRGKADRPGHFAASPKGKLLSKRLARKPPA
jgi:hypothetical protein